MTVFGAPDFDADADAIAGEATLAQPDGEAGAPPSDGDADAITGNAGLAQPTGEASALLELSDFATPAGVDMRVLALIETGTPAGNEVFDTADGRGSLLDGDNVLENTDGGNSITVGRFQRPAGGTGIIAEQEALETGYVQRGVRRRRRLRQRDVLPTDRRRPPDARFRGHIDRPVGNLAVDRDTRRSVGPG